MATSSPAWATPVTVSSAPSKKSISMRRGQMPAPLQYQEGHPIGAALFSLSVYLLCFS